MVTVYMAKLVEVSPKLLEKVSKERRDRIQKCKDVETQKQLLSAGLLLKRVLERYGLEEELVKKGAYGKPEVPGNSFNLSHTDGLVLCAVSTKPVGCDVEKIKSAPCKIAERFFCESEKKYLDESGSYYDVAFFRMWTIKESYIKMTGEGIHLPMNAFEVCIDTEVQIYREGVKVPCFIKEYCVPGYRVTVCSEEQEFSHLVWEELQELEE